MSTCEQRLYIQIHGPTHRMCTVSGLKLVFDCSDCALHQMAGSMPIFQADAQEQVIGTDSYRCSDT